MTYQELVLQAKRLPPAQRLSLIEALRQSLVEEIRPASAQPGRIALVRGMLRPNGPMPSDSELKEDYVNYLIRKYL